MLSREMCKMLIFLFFIKMTLNESIVSSTRIVCWFKVMAFILWFYVVFVLRFCENRPVCFFFIILIFHEKIHPVNNSPMKY